MLHEVDHRVVGVAVVVVVVEEEDEVVVLLPEVVVEDWVEWVRLQKVMPRSLPQQSLRSRPPKCHCVVPIQVDNNGNNDILEDKNKRKLEQNSLPSPPLLLSNPLLIV